MFGHRKLIGYVLALLAAGLMAAFDVDAGWGWVLVALFASFAGANSIRKITGGKEPVVELDKPAGVDADA